MSQDGLSGKLSSIFREMTFNKCKFSAGIQVSDAEYKYAEKQMNYPFYLINDQLDYTLAHILKELETTKGNVNTFLTNLLIKPITKKLSY